LAALSARRGADARRAKAPRLASQPSVWSVSSGVGLLGNAGSVVRPARAGRHWQSTGWGRRRGCQLSRCFGIPGRGRRLCWLRSA